MRALGHPQACRNGNESWYWRSLSLFSRELMRRTKKFSFSSRPKSLWGNIGKWEASSVVRVPRARLDLIPSQGRCLGVEGLCQLRWWASRIDSFPYGTTNITPLFQGRLDLSKKSEKITWRHWPNQMWRGVLSFSILPPSSNLGLERTVVHKPTKGLLAFTRLLCKCEFSLNPHSSSMKQ